MSKFYKVLIGPATNIVTSGGGGDGVQTITGDGVGGTPENVVLSFPNQLEVQAIRPIKTVNNESLEGVGNIVIQGGGGGGVQTVTGEGVGGTAANPVLSFPNPSDIGLGNVDNTSDANKPISNATQSALNDKVNSVTTGEPTGASVIGNIVEISQADYDTAQAAGNLNATTLYLTPNV